PDGTGPSLEIIDAMGDHNDETNWRASFAVGGSPGASGDLTGDYDRSGTVDHLDYVAWQAQFGDEVLLPGTAADGNADGKVNADDYTVWRDHLGLTFPAQASLAQADNTESAALAVAWAVLRIDQLATTPALFPLDSSNQVAGTLSSDELVLDRIYAEDPEETIHGLTNIDTDVEEASLELALAELGDYFPQ
ncbi:MAG: dockerin type I domain-containing protein, partial [Aeoliella sp.]